jgi:hypothetical protein
MSQPILPDPDGGPPDDQASPDRFELLVRAALLLALGLGVALVVGVVVKACAWLNGESGPAWMDFSASTNTDSAVRILEPGAR